MSHATSAPSAWDSAPVIFLPEVDSTNRYLKARLDSGLPEGTLVVADYQSAGLGRHGRSWHAPAGSALLLSVLFRPNWPAERAHWLTMIAGLAVTDAVRAVVPAAALKWPNDIMLPAADGTWRKTGGILQEGHLAGDRLQSVIVGIGLNVNAPAAALNFADAPVAAASLLTATGHPHDRLALLMRLRERLGAHYAAAVAGTAPRPAWQARLMTIGQSVTVSGSVNVTGTAETTDEWGRLIVRAADGQRHAVAAGDVTLRSGPD